MTPAPQEPEIGTREWFELMDSLPHGHQWAEMSLREGDWRWANRDARGRPGAFPFEIEEGARIAAALKLARGEQ